jgi:Fe-Mn family superoxide dismutase
LEQQAAQMGARDSDSSQQSVQERAAAVSLAEASRLQTEAFLLQLQWIRNHSSAVADVHDAGITLDGIMRETSETLHQLYSQDQVSGESRESAVPIGGHTLPPLPYPYDALEPHIDEETMRIHHDKHHLSYVEGLNQAERELENSRRNGNYPLIKHWERELAFHGAGHYLHTLFWESMTPNGGGHPPLPLSEAIANSFGSFEAFKQQFSEAALQVEGGGWAILVWSPRSRRLEILTAEKHQQLSQWDVIPLLALDVWEHAYYLKHQNKRADYIDAWWNVVNWPHVNARYREAVSVSWKPY